ncbi:DNA alkylation response protein [Roseomonas frigidaquae]|uniref:DNA alkylation response protein n=1 Tax=Falsiroseomonas frigidaquae TaxID=487318 RepID=A0ABX1F018_9PROT|nr:acyl-CoA dehydrogenase family protein [Falsiroseomonas frigidaquae]NKE45681.1 DNA alkylation response protein [Falsiroseomonas frigidaquae]
MNIALPHPPHGSQAAPPHGSQAAPPQGSQAAPPQGSQAAPPQGAEAVPDSRGLNLWRADPALARLAGLYLPADLLAHLAPHLDRLGGLAGGRLDELAATADRNPPVLHSRDRRGADRQHIEYHPAYRAMEQVAFGDYGLAALSHRGGVLGWAAPMPPAAKYLITYLLVQAEFGLCCPVSMTDSLARTLRRFGDPALVARYLPGLTSQDLDALDQGAMFMTEQGAGSDIAATAVMAAPNADGSWALTGDKWFCSNPDAGLAMVLARRQGAEQGAGPGLAGVSLFLLPRVLPDGTENAYRILRLKPKLGTRSMASGEIRLEGATAYLVGDPAAGFRQMADMVNNSRLSNGMRAAGLMRRAVTEALYVAHRRRAFGQRLVDMPLMRRQLAKMLLPMEQARSLMFQTAEALRRSDAGEEGAYPLLRILTPLLKFRACRDARRVTGDAMEVRGGCGYIEEWPDARLLRDAHLGSIWEGTSNIVALDVLRAAKREAALPVLRRHVMALLGNAPALPEAPAALDRAVALAERAQENPALARQAASALYHLTSAAAMAWEAARLEDAGRLELARLVLRHRVLPRDPLAAEDEAVPEGIAAGLLPDPGT